MSKIGLSEIEKAESFLEKVCGDELSYPGSPVTEALVKMNLVHSARVRKNAAVIAYGSDDQLLLELAAALHDVAKLDHRDIASGGIDTFHHHYRGAAIAKKFLLQELKLGAVVAEMVFNMINRHSCIPFIDRFWQKTYRDSVPAPVGWLEVALRDADTLDQLGIGGIHKIVHFRQTPGCAFLVEDGGDVQKAIASARVSFDEAADVITTSAGKKLTKPLKETAIKFFDFVSAVGSLAEFDAAYTEFQKV